MADALTLEQARAAVLAAAIPATERELVDLLSAPGRYLATDHLAAEAWPSTDRSAMDGYAVVAGAEGLAAPVELPVLGESLAGHPFPGVLRQGQAIRIMTGAVVPDGADAVVPVEATSGFAGDRVVIREAVRRGQNVRPRGSEASAGQLLLAAGRRIRAAEVGALAVLGCQQVQVVKAPRVAILATGDEVVPIESMPLPHQVRESNSYALAAQVHELGGVALRLGVAPDEPSRLRELLATGLADAEVLLTIGGISKGTHDLVQDCLRELGVATMFHGIQLKPGKPTFFGHRQGADGKRHYVFGLPGNPASACTVFDLLVQPLLVRLQGGEPANWQLMLPAAGAPFRANARLQALPARLVAGPAGLPQLAIAQASPSGDPFSLLQGDCYALVPPGQAFAAGVAVPVAGSASGIQLP